MKNTLLWGALFTIIGTQTHAEISQAVTPPPQTPAATHPAAPATATPNATKTAPAIINCEYKIPAETKNVDQAIVITWAEKALTQAFDFDSKNLDMQLQKLQDCFTEQGWTGFNTALQKSGNLDAIKTQNLTVSSQIDGQVVVTEAKENQWKLNLPLQVVYQNDKEKVTQLLSVDLTVGRKISGDLGITQMIAAPRETKTQEKTENTANNPTNPTVNQDNTPNQTTPTATPATTQPSTPSTTTSPSSSGTRSATPTPATPGQPTLPANRSNQPSLPATNP